MGLDFLSLRTIPVNSRRRRGSKRFRPRGMQSSIALETTARFSGSRIRGCRAAAHARTTLPALPHRAPHRRRGWRAGLGEGEATRRRHLYVCLWSRPFPLPTPLGWVASSAASEPFGGSGRLQCSQGPLFPTRPPRLRLCVSRGSQHGTANTGSIPYSERKRSLLFHRTVGWAKARGLTLHFRRPVSLCP